MFVVVYEKNMSVYATEFNTIEECREYVKTLKNNRVNIQGIFQFVE